MPAYDVRCSFEGGGGGEAVAYDAFISYSHAADGVLAPRLQAGLQRFAKPWWRRRAIRVFRDETGLSVNPHLWASIEHALDESEWFILLASPEAATSGWVARELEHWKASKDPKRILSVVTEGRWAWNSTINDFDWEVSTAVPEALRGVYDEEPRHLDMAWLRGQEQVDLRNGRFCDAIADLAAPMRGVAKDELIGDDIRQHRRALRTAWTAACLLIVLLVAAIAGGLFAVRSSNQATRERSAAIAAGRLARDQTARLTVRVVASRLQETVRGSLEAPLREEAAGDQANCMVAQLDREPALAATFASSAEDAAIAKWLSIPALATPCVDADALIYPLGLVEYSEPDLECLSAAITNEPDLRSYIDLYLGNGTDSIAARRATAIALWGEVQSACLSTRTLSTVAQQMLGSPTVVGLTPEGLPDRPDPACVQGQFETLPEDSLAVFRSSIFVEVLTQGLRPTETTFARDIAPDIDAAC
jgi:hypothetical protein